MNSDSIRRNQPVFGKVREDEMMKDNAELIAMARIRAEKYSSGSDEYVINLLADALEAAEAERASTLEQVSGVMGSANQYIAKLVAERDAAHAVIAKAHGLYGNTGGSGDDLAWAMWGVLEDGQNKAAS